jgi:hypothetical protein
MHHLSSAFFPDARITLQTTLASLVIEPIEKSQRIAGIEKAEYAAAQTRHAGKIAAWPSSRTADSIACIPFIPSG